VPTTTASTGVPPLNISNNIGRGGPDVVVGKVSTDDVFDVTSVTFAAVVGAAVVVAVVVDAVVVVVVVDAVVVVVVVVLVLVDAAVVS
jgi:hypothetical protein